MAAPPGINLARLKNRVQNESLSQKSSLTQVSGPLGPYQLLLRGDHLEASEALELEGRVVVAVVVQREVGVALEPGVALPALDHLSREGRGSILSFIELSSDNIQCYSSSLSQGLKEEDLGNWPG